jgi:hypothetical protein
MDLYLLQNEKPITSLWHYVLFRYFLQMYLNASKGKNIFACMSDSRRGFGLDIGFIDHFSSQLLITRNYSAISDFYSLPVTPEHAKSFPACSAFTTRFLITASNKAYSSTSGFRSSLNGGFLPTAYSCASCPPYNPSARTTIENPFYNSTSVVARRFVAVETCLFATVT